MCLMIKTKDNSDNIKKMFAAFKTFDFLIKQTKTMTTKMLQKALILFLFVTVKSQTTTVKKFPSTPPSPPFLPQLILTSNSSQIYLNVPFKLTCSIDHFNATGKRYSVNYYDSRDNLLATYKVDGKNFQNNSNFKNLNF